jgi:hypothetical protein
MWNLVHSAILFKNPREGRRAQIIASKNITSIAADNAVDVGVSLIIANPLECHHPRIAFFCGV